MKNSLSFSDCSVDMSVAKGLSIKNISKMITVLQKYRVMCFEIYSDTFRKCCNIRDFLPDSLIRLNVNCSSLIDTDIKSFKAVRVNWVFRDENSFVQLLKLFDELAAADIYLAIENADELNIEQLKLCLERLRHSNIKGIIYCCDGAKDIFELNAVLSQLIAFSPFPVEFDCKNQLGLASAQSLSAIHAGVCRVSVSVAGVGAHAPLEEILMAAKHFVNLDMPSCNELAPDFQRFLSLFCETAKPNKALIGPNVFAHESGIHVDGIIKNPALYEVIRPEDVGLQRKLVIGKHSGTASVRIKLLQWGYTLTGDEILKLLHYVRFLAQRQKGSISDTQFVNLYKAVVRRERHECAKTV